MFISRWRRNWDLKKGRVDDARTYRGREFQTDGPENAKLDLNRSIRGRAGIFLLVLESHRPLVFTLSLRYGGARLETTLKKRVDVLKINRLPSDIRPSFFLGDHPLSLWCYCRGS